MTYFSSLVKTNGKQVVHTSPYPASEVKPTTLLSFMLSAPSFSFPASKTLFVDALHPSKQVTTGSYRQGSVAVANLIHNKYNVQQGDVVCIYSINSVYLPQVSMGILMNGAVVSPANIMYVPEELNYQLNKTKATILITLPEYAHVAHEAVKMGQGDGKPSTVKHIVFLEDLVHEALESFMYSETEVYNSSLDDLLKILPKAASQITKDSHSYYCFSSGTSGVPKGVITTHGNIVANIQQETVATGRLYSPEKAIGAVIPMSHIYGLSQFVYFSPYLGMKAIVFPRFDFEILLHAIVKYQVNLIHIVPPIAVLLAKSPLVEKHPSLAASLEGLICGAAPLSQDLAEQVTARLGCPLWQAYGMTEASPMTHGFILEGKNYNNASIGWLVPGMEARVVAEDGKEIDSPHVPGELWLKGPNMFRGYLDNPEANKSSFAEISEGSSNGDPMEWFKTGDVVTVDEDGLYYVVDRVKELIKSKGHQVAPAELEAILLTSDQISDCAVTGISVPELGTEYPRAFVVFKEGVVSPHGKTEKEAALEIKKWFEAKVAKHKWLWGGITVLHQIPKSPSGKILRRLLSNQDVESYVVYGYETKAKL